MLKINLPFVITLPRVKVADKVIRLNLNWYRNVNPFTNNHVKQLFKDVIPADARAARFNTPVKLVYTLYYDKNIRVDVSNVLSVVDKYASDALVECEIIPEDNWKVVREATYRWGGVDKENPRVELEIVPA